MHNRPLKELINHLNIDHTILVTAIVV